MNNQRRYLISYFDNSKSHRVYYLNRTSFSQLADAKREVRLLKERENKNHPKMRIRFKIEESVVKIAL